MAENAGIDANESLTIKGLSINSFAAFIARSAISSSIPSLAVTFAEIHKHARAFSRDKVEAPFIYTTMARKQATHI